jgi:FtsH-binding integral membrane protein
VQAARVGDLGEVSNQVSWLFPQDNDAELFHTVCSRIDRFNSEPVRARLGSQVAEVAASLLPGVEAADDDQELGTAFAYADRLAAHYQRITHRVLRLTLLVAAVMAIIFEVYAEVLPLRSVPLAYLLCFALLTLILFWHRRLDAQGRYLDYRALAEGLRVQYYWRLAGLTDNTSASYLRKQLDELRWIREALRATGAAPPPSSARPELALKRWVHGQADYYATHARVHERRTIRMGHWSQASLTIGLIAAFCLVALWRLLERFAPWHHWTVLIMGIAPISAALWETYAERIGSRTQANQYARFAAIFLRAERLIDRLELEPATASRRQSELTLLRELGREALIENADWVLLLRDRPIALPKG